MIRLLEFMEASEFTNFNVLQSEVIDKHFMLQANKNNLVGGDPLVSYSGFRLFFNGIHLMPKLLIGDNFKPIGSIDQLNFKLNQKNIVGKLSYYLTFEIEFYAVWIGLSLDKSIVGDILIPRELLAFTNKLDIPKNQVYSNNLDYTFVQDVLALHFKALFFEFDSIEFFADLKMEGEIIERAIEYYKSRYFT